MPPWPRINIIVSFCHSRQAPPACRTLLRLFCVTKVTLFNRMKNVDRSYMTIILNLKPICRTNRVTHEVFAGCWKICGILSNHAKCVTGGNPIQNLLSAVKLIGWQTEQKTISLQSSIRKMTKLFTKLYGNLRRISLMRRS